ncbi:MAG: hypothetical protein AAF608_05540 [Pseudomonadota bacterium]
MNFGKMISGFGAMCAAAALAGQPAHAANVTEVGSIDGTLVDFASLSAVPITGSNPVFLDPDASVFTDAGISSITASQRPSDNNERYNSGGTFGAGRALFADDDGNLLVLDEGAVFDFAAPTFTINFESDIEEFSFRIADTSNGFATPRVTFLKDGETLASVLIDGAYNAQNTFAFVLDMAFDAIEINVDTVASFDGAGISELRVGAAVDPNPIPVPGALPLMAAGLAGLWRVRKNRTA